MNLRQLLNRPEKPMGKLIYITNLDLFYDRVPINTKLLGYPVYKYIQRFAIISEQTTEADTSILKNPFWAGHSADYRDNGKYPGPITHFWNVNLLEKYEHCYIHIDLPLFTEKDFMNRDIDDKDLQERLYKILEKYTEIKEKI